MLVRQRPPGPFGGLCVLRHKAGPELSYCWAVYTRAPHLSLLRSALTAGRLRRQWIAALFPRRHSTPANPPCTRQCQPLVLLRGRRCALTSPLAGAGRRYCPKSQVRSSREGGFDFPTPSPPNYTRRPIPTDEWRSRLFFFSSLLSGHYI